MLIFAVLSSAVVGLVVKTLQTSTKADNKNAAANLADAKKEYFVGAAWDDVVSDTDTVDADGTPWTSAAQGVAYTVKSTVALVPNTESACTTNGAELTRKLVTVDVTWPGMTSDDRVTNQTFRRIYQADAAKIPGAAAWQLNVPSFSSSGAVTWGGLGGIAVSAYDSNGSLAASAVTDRTGCAVVSDLPAGGYSLVVNTPQHLGQNNQQRQTAAVTVQAGKISVPEALRYAPSSSAKLKLVTVSGYNAPTNPWTDQSATFFADTVGGYQTRTTCAGTVDPLYTACLGTDGTVGRLFPTAYSGYLGSCADTKATTSDFVPRWIALDVPTVAVNLGALQYKVVPALSTGVWTVTATHASGPSCTGQTIALGTTASGAVNRVGLPQGEWTITATSPAGAKATATVTVTTTAPSSPALLVTL